MGRDDSVRQRNPGEVLEELLQSLRTSLDQQRQAIEQLAAQQTDWIREFRQELSNALVQEEREIRALRALVEVIASQIHALNPAGTFAGAGEADGSRWREVRRTAEEALAKSTALDHSVATTLAAIRERLDELSAGFSLVRRAVETLAEPQSRGVGEKMGSGSRPAKGFASGERDSPAVARLAAMEEEDELRREWKGALAALHQQLVENREEESRRWRSLEHRLQDLEHALGAEPRHRPSPHTSTVLLLVLLGLILGAALARVLQSWPGAGGLAPSTTPPVSTAEVGTGNNRQAAPSKRPAWLERADDALVAGNAAGAERVLRQALRQAPDDVGLRMRLAIALAEQRRVEAAREQLNEILRIDPNAFEALQLLVSLRPEPPPGSASATPGSLIQTPSPPLTTTHQAVGGRAKARTKLPGHEATELGEPEMWLDEFELP